MDAYGRLDLPPGLEGVDAVYAASLQAPSPDGPMNPRSTRKRIDEGELDPDMVLRWMVDGTAAALHHHEHIVIAHLFSVLAELGIEEGDVPLDLVDALARAASETDARIEVNEHWRCPTMRTLRPFLRHRVPLLLSSGSHDNETIGRYDHCADVAHDLRALAVSG